MRVLPNGDLRLVERRAAPAAASAIRPTTTAAQNQRNIEGTVTARWYAGEKAGVNPPLTGR
jgi:hypothetical protein